MYKVIENIPEQRKLVIELEDNSIEILENGTDTLIADKDHQNRYTIIGIPKGGFPCSIAKKDDVMYAFQWMPEIKLWHVHKYY